MISVPNVSVVMPVFNAARFLKEALESILTQSYEDFELIVINDGSTDSSEAIITSFCDSRIRYYYQKNAGVAAALNKGIEMARGVYIWRHDADDISLPTKLEEQIKFLKENPEFDLCAVQVAFMTERGKPAWNFRQPKKHYFIESPFAEIKREHFNPYSPIVHGTVLMLTSAVKSLNGYRKEFITSEDVDLWLRFIEKYRAAVINKCLSLHRLSSSSATKKHGWKNEYFRNLALTYSKQREGGDLDDLAKGCEISLPAAPVQSHSLMGRTFRADLLQFNYALHIDAKDWEAVREIIIKSLIEGWRLKRTWMAIILPLFGTRNTSTLIKFKKRLYEFFGSVTIRVL